MGADADRLSGTTPPCYVGYTKAVVRDFGYRAELVILEYNQDRLHKCYMPNRSVNHNTAMRYTVVINGAFITVEFPGWTQEGVHHGRALDEPPTIMLSFQALLILW